MKKKIISMMLIVVVMFTYVISDNITVLNANELQTETKEYVIMVQDNKVQEIVDDYSENIIDVSNEFSTEEDANLVKAELTKEQAANINKEAGVVAVEENQQVKALTENKPEVETVDIEKWNLSMVNTPKKIKNRTNVKVAVLDSGIDFNERVNVKGRINLVEDDYRGTAFFEDVTSHGTSVAGVIAKMNPNVDIYSVKVLSSLNKADIDTVVKGIYWCIENDIDIINMSFGTLNNSQILEHAIKDAYSKGIIMVGAVGNDGEEGSVQYPAAYKEVISVGAVGYDGKMWEKTSTNGEIDVLAPGEKILTDGAFASEYIAGGTSMAVPHVVGAISIIMQYCKSKDTKLMKNILKYSAKKLDGYNSGVLDIEYAIKVAKKGIEKVNDQKEDFYEKNQDKLQTFSKKDFVEARWDACGHHIITENASSSSYEFTDITIIKQACMMMDGQSYEGNSYTWEGFTDKQREEYLQCEIQFKRRTQLVLHGNFNYVATLNYLYTVAKEVDNTSDNETIGSVCRRISYNPGTGEAVYNKCIKNNLVEAIQFLCSKDRIFGFGATPSRHEKSLRILGMAVHLAADVFAHKTRVPTTVSIQNYRDTQHNVMLASDLKSVSDFRSMLDKKMPFNRIVNYIRKNSDGNSRHNYEDDGIFYAKRFTAATGAVQKVLQAYKSGNSTIKADEVFKRDTSTECKVAYLDKYVKQVYSEARGDACKEYKFTPGDMFKDSYDASWSSLK